MRIAVGAGHNVFVNNNFDCGAVSGSIRECDITKETVKNLIPLLKAQGHQVLDVTPYNQRFTSSREHHVLRCNRADNFNADIYLDIHINSGGGTGAEAWVYSNTGVSADYGVKILNNLCTNVGLRNRGLKVNQSYWTVSLCKCPSIIVEGAFIDTPSDMKKLNAQNYAESTARSFGSVNNTVLQASKSNPKIVAYLGDADVFVSVLLSQKLQCPLIQQKHITSQVLSQYDVMYVGGTKGVIKGKDRFDTTKQIANKYL